MRYAIKELPERNLSPEEIELTTKHHNEKMDTCPFYQEGYNSKEGESCPYEPDRDLWIKMLTISQISRRLTQDEKDTLKEYNRLLDLTPYNKWSSGRYHKRYKFLCK